MQLTSITCSGSAPFAVAYKQFVIRHFLHADGLTEALLPTKHNHKQLNNTVSDMQHNNTRSIKI